ncbi:uncharacterized protein LOC113515903 [Galleria mellonella]|uniref:Odorant receptor n=1 Tax=Galleria mellonella TaxID=7137 RepID=A0ABM3N6M2_GALME|nr:uncharacterized protein LOC113515903 [Galleria mellonella]
MKPFSKFTFIDKIKTVGDKNEVDKTMHVILIVQQIFGLQILDPKWTWKTSGLKHFMTACLTVYVLYGTYDAVEKVADVELIAEACFTFILISARIFKACLFANKKYTFRKLYLLSKTSILDILKTESENTDGSLQVLKKGQRAVFIFFLVIVIPFSSYVFTALWSYIKGNRTPVSKTTSILMPLSTPYFEIGCILHMISMFQIGFIILVVDLWFVFLMLFYCMASDNIIKILKVEKRGLEEDKKQYADRLNRSLKNFYEAHVKINEYLNTMSEMFRWLAAIPLYMVTICTCLILLLMSKKINWAFTSTTIPLFAEIFVFNWFGEQVKSKAYKLKLLLLHFDWLSLQYKDRKSYHIIVCYMNKNFGIKTAFGNELSFITMTSVLKASYQAFTVLQTLDD